MAALAGSAVHAVFSVGPVATVRHVVPVQLFPAPATPAVQLAAGTSVAATVLQVVVV